MADSLVKKEELDWKLEITGEASKFIRSKGDFFYHD